MPRSRFYFVFVLGVVFALLLAACGGPTPTSTPRPTATEAAAEEEATEEAEAEETEAAEEEATEAAEEEATEAAEEEATEEAEAEETEAAEEEATEAAEEEAEETEEAVEVAMVTEEATEEAEAEETEAAEEMATEEAEEEATEAAAEEEATEEAEAEETEAAEEMATEEPGEEATEAVEAEATEEGEQAAIIMLEDLVVPTSEAEPTEEAEEEATEVAMATEEATEEAEEVATEEPEEEATEEMATEVPTEEAEEMATEEATDEPSDTTTAIADGATVTIASDSEVIIGVAVGLSGEGIAPLGVDIQRGAELALEDRPSVTVGGEEFAVSLDVQDEQCSAEGGQTVANRFASDASIVGVVGPMCSGACRAAAPILDEAGYVSISPSCTAPDLTMSEFASFNRAVPSDAFQGVVAADFIYNTLGLRRIATVHDGSAYGEGLVSVLTAAFEELGGEVVASDAVNVGDTDFRGLLEDFAAEEPELIYFGGFPAEAARLAEQRADAGLEDTVFMGGDGVKTTEFIELAGDAGEGAYASSPIPASSEELDAFLARYVETYGEEPPAPFHANGYDAVNMLLDGIEAVGELDADGNLVVDRAALSEYVRSISDYQGLTGVLNCDGTGECATAEIGFVQVIDGEFVDVEVE